LRSRPYIWAAIGAAAAIAIPRLWLAGDPWIDAARFVRAHAQRGDLVVLAPAARVDRLAAFDGTWAVAADAASLGGVDRFPRIFWVADRDVPPPRTLRLVLAQTFGRVEVRVLSR
jgi:hypothetical protein